MAIRSNGETTYEGCVLYDWERNYHDDSDFYALVWDEAEGRIRTVEWGTTRFAGLGSCSTDATEEVQKAAATYLARVAFDRWVEANYAQAATVEKGKEVVCTATRGKNKGKRGTVIWYGVAHAAYSEWSKVWRVGVRQENGEVFWTGAENVQVIDPLEYARPLAEGLVFASQVAADRRWSFLIATPAGVVRAL